MEILQSNMKMFLLFTSITMNVNIHKKCTTFLPDFWLCIGRRQSLFVNGTHCRMPQVLLLYLFYHACVHVCVHQCPTACMSEDNLRCWSASSSLLERLSSITSAYHGQLSQGPDIVLLLGARVLGLQPSSFIAAELLHPALQELWEPTSLRLSHLHGKCSVHRAVSPDPHGHIARSECC